MSQPVDDWLSENLPLEVFGSSGKGLAEFSKIISHSIDLIRKKNVKIVTIAGTNGKGETARRLAYLLNHQAKINYALWSSPHLISVTERFEYNQKAISSKQLMELFQGYKNKASELSYYEFLFLIFCKWVEQLDLDVLILEVGLGGRLDCVNCFDAHYVALTSIGLDHTEFLGDTLESILLEKLGVLRDQSKLVSALLQKDLRAKTKSIAEQKNIELHDLCEQGLINEQSHFKLINRMTSEKLYFLITGENVGSPTWEFFNNGLGRGDWLKTNFGQFLMMGSHNADGLMALEEWLEHSENEFFDGIFVGLSKRPTRELSHCIKITFEYLKRRSNQFSLVGHTHAKAVDKRYLEKTLACENSDLFEQILPYYKEFDTWWKSIEANKNPKTRYLITGSYYFIAQILSHLDNADILSYKPSDLLTK